MGKSYVKYKARAETVSERFPKRKDKIPKVSQHGAHCNQKNCNPCAQYWQAVERQNKNFKKNLERLCIMPD